MGADLERDVYLEVGGGWSSVSIWLALSYSTLGNLLVLWIVVFLVAVAIGNWYATGTGYPVADIPTCTVYNWYTLLNSVNINSVYIIQYWYKISYYNDNPVFMEGSGTEHFSSAVLSLISSPSLLIFRTLRITIVSPRRLCCPLVHFLLLLPTSTFQQPTVELIILLAVGCWCWKVFSTQYSVCTR